ncbi:hypothetical protein CHUAL_012092 [Chamberlinius hualienensis]
MKLLPKGCLQFRFYLAEVSIDYFFVSVLVELKLTMLTLYLLLIVSLVLQCVCDNSSLCNEVRLKPSDYEIKPNNTVFISVANLTIFNATLKGNDICVPLSKEFLTCKSKQLWIKYLFAIELNLYARLIITGQFYDPTNYLVLQNGSFVICGQPDEVISEWGMYVAYWANIGLFMMSAVLLLICLGLNLIFFPSTCHSKCLSCHLASVAMLFVAYSFQQYLRNLRNLVLCYFLFFMDYFPLMAGIFWLNVISIETWYFFSQMQTSPYIIPAVSTCKRWRIYQLYAWGTPLILTSLVIIANLLTLPSPLANIFDPLLELSCWINSPIPLDIFYYAPVGVLMLSTFIFFGLTVHIIKSASLGTVLVIRNGRNSIFCITLKLVLVTGVFWTVLVINDVIGFNSLLWFAVHYRFGLFGFFSVSGQGVVIGLLHIERFGVFKKWKCSRITNIRSTLRNRRELVSDFI